MGTHISIVERTDAQWSRSKVIIHNGMFYFAEFDTVGQLDFFAKTLGFTYVLRDESESERCGLWKNFDLDRHINSPCNGGFWKLEDLSAGVRPIKALSNGNIVTCYFLNDGETITIYRPNPNAKDVYRPLSLEEHIAHQKIYGKY